jgi:hypothetical protein
MALSRAIVHLDPKKSRGAARQCRYWSRRGFCHRWIVGKTGSLGIINMVTCSKIAT